MAVQHATLDDAEFKRVKEMFYENYTGVQNAFATCISFNRDWIESTLDDVSKFHVVDSVMPPPRLPNVHRHSIGQPSLSTLPESYQATAEDVKATMYRAMSETIQGINRECLDIIPMLKVMSGASLTAGDMKALDVVDRKAVPAVNVQKVQPDNHPSGRVGL